MSQEHPPQLFHEVVNKSDPILDAFEEDDLLLAGDSDTLETLGHKTLDFSNLIADLEETPTPADSRLVLPSQGPLVLDCIVPAQPDEKLAAVQQIGSSASTEDPILITPNVNKTWTKKMEVNDPESPALSASPTQSPSSRTASRPSYADVAAWFQPKAKPKPPLVNVPDEKEEPAVYVVPKGPFRNNSAPSGRHPRITSGREEEPELDFEENEPTARTKTRELRHDHLPTPHPLKDCYMRQHPITKFNPETPIAVRVADTKSMKSIVAFRHVSLSKWRVAPTLPPELIPVPKKNKTFNRLQTTRTVKPDEATALYVIVENLGNASIASPLHIELVGPDRPDLHMVELTQCSCDKLNKYPIHVGNYVVGDLLEVTELARNPKLLPSDFSTDMKLVNNATGSKFWRIREFQLVERDISTNETLIVHDVPPPNSQKKKIQLIAEGCPKLIITSNRLFRDARLTAIAGKYFNGSFYTPKVHPGRLLASVKDDKVATVIAATSSVLGLGPMPPVLLNVSAYPDNKKWLIEDPLTSFKAQRSHEKKTETLCKTLRLGLSGVLALENVNLDTQKYVTTLSRVEPIHQGLRIAFALRSPSGPPSPASWTSGVQFNATVTGASAFLAKVETNRLATRELFITARVMHQEAPNPNIIEGSEILVAQFPSENELLLKCLPRPADILSKKPDLPGLRTIRALTGGTPIRHRFPDTPPPIIAATEPLPTELNKEQSHYISCFSKESCPAMILNAPFGVGKTLTLAVAAMESAHHGYHDNLHVAAGVNNATVTAIVKAWQRVDPHGTVPLVRLISEDNRERMDPEHLTDYDLPKLIVPVLVAYILDCDDRLESGRAVKKFPDLFDVVYHLDALGHLPTDLRKVPLALASARKPAYSLMEVFFAIYRPRIVVGTVASILGYFSTPHWSRCSVGTVQIDEGSQVPRHLVFALLNRFPEARFALIGDQEQLPPFKDLALNDDLDKFAVGNLLRDASKLGLLPIFDLTKVYRTPRKATLTLSCVFYSGRLEPARPPKIEKQIQQLQLEAEFPFQWILLPSHHRQAGTSLVNPEEAAFALSLARLLRSRCGLTTVAILCFYKAQAALISSMLTDDKTFVGTIDSSQGREWRATVVCTTRTDGFQTCPFLMDAARINVALSRSRGLTFILGSPEKVHGSAWTSIVSATPADARSTSKDLMKLWNLPDLLPSSQATARE